MGRGTIKTESKSQMLGFKLPELTARSRAAKEDGFTVSHFQGEVTASLILSPKSDITVYVRPTTGPQRDRDTDIGTLVCKGEDFNLAFHGDLESSDALAHMLIKMGHRMLRPNARDNLDADSN